MVNDVACNDIVHRVSIMTAKNAYSVQTGRHYIGSYICYITFVESDYFLWGKKTTK